MAGGGLPPPEKSSNAAVVAADEGPIPPFPIGRALILGITVVNESLCANMLLPFIALFVAHLQGKSAEEAGFASGFLVAVFQLGQVIAGKRWGFLSDKYGRKPALQGGLIFSGVIMILFGLSPNIYVSVILRFIHGLANGNILVAKAMIPEVMGHKAHEAKGYTIPSITWCLGTLVGPAIGGALYDPTRYGWFPLGPDSIFGTHPALLPSLAIGIYSFFALAVCTVFLPETNANAKAISWGQKKKKETHAAEEGTVAAAPAPPKTKFGFKQAFQLPLTRIILILYMIISYADIAFFETLPLWAVAGRSYGGLSMTSETVGLVILINGLPGMCANLFFSAALNKLGGPVKLFRIACTIWIIANVLIPYAHVVENTTVCLAFMSVLIAFRVMGAAWCFSTCFLLIGRSAPPGHLGSINGIGQSAGCMTRTIAPILVAPIFAWSIQEPRPYPFNYHLAFLVGWIPLIACFFLVRAIAHDPVIFGLPPVAPAAGGTIDIPADGGGGFASDDEGADGVMNSTFTTSLQLMQCEDMRSGHHDELVPTVIATAATLRAANAAAAPLPPLGQSAPSVGQSLAPSNNASLSHPPTAAVLGQRIAEATRQARSRANSLSRQGTPAHGPLGASAPRRFVVVGSSPGIPPQLVLLDAERPSELSI